MSKDTFIVPIGPQHPALKEPASFALTLSGENVLKMDVRLGYNHRGIEKACEERTYIQDVYLIERICGICSHAHANNFVRAIEEVAGVEVPRRGKFIRSMMGELERIHSHLLWLGVAGHEIGFDTLLMYSWRDREAVMDLLAMLSGNRVNYSANAIGGARFDVTPEHCAEILRVMDVLDERTKYYLEVASEESTIHERLCNVGRITLADVNRLGTVGPTARASGWAHDVRKDDPYDAYVEAPFKLHTADTADVFGRTVVRVLELFESYNLVRWFVKNLPDGEVAAKVPRRIGPGEAVARYEAPRGEDVHYVKGNGTDKPERVRVRAPTMANLQSVAKMLEDSKLADVPITIAAIDPCFSCTDRMIELTDADGGRSGSMSWGDLREYGIQYYRGRGVDLSRVKLHPKG